MLTGNTPARALFSAESPKGLCLVLFFFVFISDLPLHVTSDMVNCEMFADDTIPDASNTDPVSVENELQKSINEVSDGCSKNAMVLQPAKRKSMLLATRQKQQLRPLNLSLKADHIEQIHKHRHFGVIIDDEFSGQSHVTYACKAVPKKLFFYYLNSNILWTLPSVSYLIMLTFLLVLHMPPLSGMNGAIFYSKKLNSVHRRAAKLMLSDPSTTTEAKILGFTPAQRETYVQ